jgi:hypothetical protein
MSIFRTLSATLVSAAASFSLVTASCGTNAVGVDDCRDIEQARCDASTHCLNEDGKPVVTDDAACRRYYRDHCLHGLPANPPSGASVSVCVQVIKSAGACAKDDPDSELGCTETATKPQQGLRTACDLVARPELADECSFLLETPDTGGDDQGGAGAGGQSSDGASAGSAGQATGGADSQGDSAQ